MPALITPGARSSKPAPAGGLRAMSRVNSFKRSWDDDDEPGQGSSQDMEGWSPSPERIPRKHVYKSVSGPAPAARAPGTAPTRSVPAAAPQSNAVESAADRRRRAILAAANEMTDKPAAGGSRDADPIEPSAASSSRSTPMSMPVASSSRAPMADGSGRPPLQELPSLGIKRAMPWEQDSKVVKKPARTGSGRSTKSDSSASSLPTLDIKQKMVLSQEQQEVLKLVVQQSQNIFFTGSAGTGKSVLLREIIRSLRKKYVSSPDAVAVTASTGIAACNIGGVTLHSFGGCGIAIEPVDVLVSKVRKNKKASARWLRTKVLIVDEVSMVDGDLFDKFCKIGQKLRKSPKPFGGIQVIVTGDFFQLPPVTKGGGVPTFAFEASTWNETINMSVNLTKVFRQKDQRFVDMLNEMRFGRLSYDSVEAFKQLSRPIFYTDGIEPTNLFPRREDVDRANLQRLNALTTDGWSYASSDGGAITDPAQRDKMLANFMAPQSITLKVDAQVMLIKNVDETLVNGSMGKVVGFCHKMLYVTDTSGRWIEDGDLAGLDEDDIEKRSRTRQMILAKMAANTKPLPVVQFKVPGPGHHVRDMLVEPDTFKNELPNGEIQVSRQQLPLILAWAMSIHKSQGQTLDRVKVDLGKVFEKGQAYVALSRATSLEGLQVLGFQREKVMAHPKVAAWTAKLRDLNKTK